jgi:hypothetical protein
MHLLARMNRSPLPPPTDPAPSRAGLLETVRAVAASFFGVRSARAHDSDMKRLNPVAVIVVGLLLAAAFVAVLVTAARLAAS